MSRRWNQVMLCDLVVAGEEDAAKILAAAVVPEKGAKIPTPAPAPGTWNPFRVTSLCAIVVLMMP